MKRLRDELLDSLLLTMGELGRARDLASVEPERQTILQEAYNWMDKFTQEEIEYYQNRDNNIQSTLEIVCDLFNQTISTHTARQVLRRIGVSPQHAHTFINNTFTHGQCPLDLANHHLMNDHNGRHIAKDLQKYNNNKVLPLFDPVLSLTHRREHCHLSDKAYQDMLNYCHLDNLTQMTKNALCSCRKRLILALTPATISYEDANVKLRRCPGTHAMVSFRYHPDFLPEGIFFYFILFYFFPLLFLGTYEPIHHANPIDGTDCTLAFICYPSIFTGDWQSKARSYNAMLNSRLECSKYYFDSDFHRAFGNDFADIMSNIGKAFDFNYYWTLHVLTCDDIKFFWTFFYGRTFSCTNQCNGFDTI